MQRLIQSKEDDGTNGRYKNAVEIYAVTPKFVSAPVEILIGPDSILLIHPPLEMDTGILMQGVGHCERECYPFDGKRVQGKINEEKTVREMRERKWL